MKKLLVTLCEYLEPRLFERQLWSCGTQAQKLKELLKDG